jgi:hypothetical protein
MKIEVSLNYNTSDFSADILGQKTVNNHRLCLLLPEHHLTLKYILPIAKID